MGCKGSKVKSNNRSQPQNPPPQKAADNDRKQPVPSGGGDKNSVDSRYDVGEEIGRGAFSVVKRGKNKKTGEDVAIKYIEKKFVDPQDLVLLSREIDIMKKIQHKNVLRLIEVFESDDIISLVMELVTGGELFYKIVEKGSYTERDAANIIRQVLEGVSYLHDQGIAHRDIKPENLLCAENSQDEKPFRVVIADFGLSKVFGGGEQLETSCGTPDYVAPEVITAEGSYDQSVDMWSIGVVTYVLLCGFSPFLSSTQTGLFEKIIKAEYDFPDPEWTNISQTAKDFIRHLLIKDPAARLTASKALQHEWLKVAASAPLASISDKMQNYNEKRRAEQKDDKKK